VYLYENKQIRVLPNTIVDDVKATFIRKPLNVEWAYSTGPQGQYIQDVANSQDFELESSEQVNVILRILQYSGIICCL
jgi:hypothetical protein